MDSYSVAEQSRGKMQQAFGGAVMMMEIPNDWGEQSGTLAGKRKGGGFEATWRPCFAPGTSHNGEEHHDSTYPSGLQSNCKLGSEPGPPSQPQKSWYGVLY